MSIQWADDFGRYGTGGGTGGRGRMLDGLVYANLEGSIVADPDPLVVDGRCYQLGNGGTDWDTKNRVALPTVISGVARAALRFWPSALPNTSSRRMSPIGFQNGAGTIIAMLVVEQNGSIDVWGRVSNVNFTVVGSTVNPVITPAAWNHLEMEHNRATGSGKVYVNGLERLSYSGVDIDDGNIELFHFLGAVGNTTATPSYIKDLVLADDAGSVNNGVLGTVLVGRLKPTDDIALGDWTPSTGTTGFNLLAKDAPNDATFLSAADTPMPSADMRFSLDSLPPDVTSVRALITVTRARKIDGGDGNLQDALSPNGTDWDNGADRPITTTFQYDFDVSELSPATSAPWTPLEVDNGQIRIDRTV